MACCIGAANHRLCIRDKCSGLSFLIDTGANASVIPRCKVQLNFGTADSDHHKYSLYAANGTPIRTYGTKLLILNLGLRREYKWTFIIADVSQPILGADFLAYYKLLVDVASRKLVDQVTQLNVIAGIVHCEEQSVKTVDLRHPFYDILIKYPDITKPISFKEPPKHSVYHYIETNGPPVHAKARPLPPHRYSKVKEEFRLMQELGICRPSKSAWASPLHRARGA